jgi:hypothetical protein
VLKQDVEHLRKTARLARRVARAIDAAVDRTDLAHLLNDDNADELIGAVEEANHWCRQLHAPKRTAMPWLGEDGKR